jgi:hypothetical protein
MIPDKNSSTQIRPIANFEYIFSMVVLINYAREVQNTDEEVDS